MKGTIDGAPPKKGISMTDKLRALWSAVYKGLCRVEYLLGHPVLGALTLAAGSIHPVYAVCWVWLYVQYEFSEERIINDKAYVALKDFMVGLGVTTIIVFIWRLL